MWQGVVLSDGSEAAELNGVHVVPTSAPGVLVELVERLEPRWLVLASHPVQAAEADVVTALVAGRWPQLGLANLRTTHAPLAVVCALAQARAVFNHPGRGFGLAQQLLVNGASGAWLPSVTRLRSPAPSLLQHARSLLPGEGFVVRQHPRPAVLDLATPAFEADGVPRVLVTEDGVPAELGRRVMAATEVSSARQLDVPGAWPRLYGTARAAQLALLPAQPELYVRDASYRCPSCALELPTLTCPFCRISATPEVATGRIPVVTA